VSGHDAPEEIEGYEVPLHVALTQPILMGGAPRTFAILNGTLALVIGMGLAPVVAWISGGRGAAHGGRADEQTRPALV
jgi:type IV secretion system protein TrbD